jgi:O-antigen ligase
VRFAFIVAAAAALIVVVPRVNAFHRLAQTVQAFGVGVDPNRPPPDATGTAHARLEAWRATISYTNATTPRRLFGVGFGPNFLHSSGADELLSGRSDSGVPLYTGVRAPHNFLLNTYARMGLSGLAVVVAALISVLVAAVRLMRRSPPEFDVFVVAVFVAVLVVAMFGVILESPFGAIPAFWAAGWILCRAAAGTGPLQGPTVQASG